jgi:AraC-like DNA-binding protein
MRGIPSGSQPWHMHIITHHTISDLYTDLHLPAGEAAVFAVHFKPDIIRDIPFKSPVFRAEYFSFGFIRAGSGRYTIDEHPYSFGPRTVYVTNPGHLKSFEIDSLQDAYMITASEQFLREAVHPDIFDEFPFLLAEAAPAHVLEQEGFEGLYTLVRHMSDEFRRDSAFKHQILGSLLTALLLKLKEACWMDYNPMLEGSRNSQIVKSFRQMLDAHFKAAVENRQSPGKLQAQEVGEKLNLHPNYLNSVIKAKTGRTINEWIAAKTLSAAKSLLHGTGLSAKEIAYRLGFSEPTHFIRFFKKHEHATPIAYRKSRML